ncbi:MAG TPA: hypothetical protein VMN57_10530 [Anaerolineales bacterium]|nr:hypothetical protein [Anaerolineales bacterium]
MLSKFNPANIWRNVKELDLQQIRTAAEKDIRIVLAGSEPEKLQTLANHLRRDPRRPDVITHTLIPLIGIDEAGGPAAPDLIVLVFSEEPDQAGLQAERLKEWDRAGYPVIALMSPEADAGNLPLLAGGFTPVFAQPDDWYGLHAELAPAILKLLSDDIMALGRAFPMLREMAARKLISDTSQANAAYSFSTGLAETIPGLNVPLNVADMIILTKAQALLVYKLGLTLGLTPDWQYYITEFSGVIGSGFLWRQVARSLVGLIPAWGIIPKVAVAYSGTYTVGQAVLHWYLTGKHATRRMLRGFMKDALARGRTLGRNLRSRLPKRKAEQMLPEGAPAPVKPSPDARICTNCATINEPDARYCKVCGQVLQDVAID